MLLLFILQEPEFNPDPQQQNENYMSKYSYLLFVYVCIYICIYFDVSFSPLSIFLYRTIHFIKLYFICLELELANIFGQVSTKKYC